ncbi:hypothetical protein GGR54DRAFT_590223 [Hypoxylon sp. NC1633]|nr:hypothetical protein GGR54DRAFT_590223 [Hypoxylon sp. NC1633]
MADNALREMVRALRSQNPGIGLKKLTTEVSALLPESMAPEKNKIKDICQHLDAQDQPGTQLRTRNNGFDARVRAAIEMFRDAERAYMLALDNKTKRTIRIASRAPSHPSWYAASQLRHYFEVLLTLKGKKPCTLMTMNGGRENAAMINGIMFQCLAPMMEQFELESFGFTLHYLAHDVLTEQVLHPGFKGAWIFADTQAEKWSQVEDIFLLPHPGRRNPDDAIGAALAYPVPGGDATVLYIDSTETSELKRITGDDKVDGVIGMEFFCIEGPLMQARLSTLVEHFYDCSKIAHNVGMELKMNAKEHPLLERFLLHIGFNRLITEP